MDNLDFYPIIIEQKFVHTGTGGRWDTNFLFVLASSNLGMAPTPIRISNAPIYENKSNKYCSCQVVAGKDENSSKLGSLGSFCFLYNFAEIFKDFR